MRLFSSSFPENFSHSVGCVLWLLVLAAGVSLSWFIVDDAFISFRYARNFLEGHGLVFNVGERVEGYSNFLWVLELAFLWGLFGWRPEVTSLGLSIAWTGLTLVLLVLWASLAPSLSSRRLVSWMALGLVCTSATFAVWSTGGLETRQFTALVLAAVLALGLRPRSPRCLLVASFCLGLASLTRPEGLLLGFVCGVWWLLLACSEPRTTFRRSLAALVLPGLCLVLAHFVFRLLYYGEWLPNTVTAKSVRPWYDMGFLYLEAAALETGLFLILPLALLGAVVRWRRCRDGMHFLSLALIAVHALGVARMGGDHFEWRVLDFWWPLLALAAAEGMLALAACCARSVHWPVPVLAGAFFGVVLVYSNLTPGLLLFVDAGINRHNIGLVELRPDRNPLLSSVPGLRPLYVSGRGLRRVLHPRMIQMQLGPHRVFTEERIRDYAPLEPYAASLFPPDARMAASAMGAAPFYLHSLSFVDYFGLVDPAVARHPFTRINRARMAAHDRLPPAGYFDRRGTNIEVSGGLHPTAGEALAKAHYAYRLVPGRWMAFDSFDRQWVLRHFGGGGRLRSNLPLDTPSLRPLADAAVAGARLLVRDVFDIYLRGRTLVYVRTPCTRDLFSVSRTVGRFFVRLWPEDLMDLPLPRRRRHGFDLDRFRFRAVDVVSDREACVAEFDLPAYPVHRIETGYILWSELELWSVGFNLESPHEVTRSWSSIIQP